MTSASVSKSSNVNDAETNDIFRPNYKEKLIYEVKKRPGLWDKEAKYYRDKYSTPQLWMEVTEAIYGNYINSLSEEERRKKVKTIQTIWKNIKDYFKKEIDARQGRQKKYYRNPSKKKYKYFDSLLFLAPELDKEKRNKKDRAEKSKKSDFESLPFLVPSVQDNKSQTGNNVSNITSEESEDISRESEIQGYSPLHSSEIKLEPKYEDIYVDSSQESEEGEQTQENWIKPTHTMENKFTQELEYDEEINFSKMLVPMLKRLNDDQKYYAKVEILTVLKNAKAYPFNEQN